MMEVEKVDPDEKTKIVLLPSSFDDGSGCVHLAQMMSHSAETSRKFKTSFANLQEDILNLPKATLQTLKDPQHPDKGIIVLCPTFLCTQCTTICQARGCTEHYESRRHTFFVQSKTGYLYCAACDNFIFTHWLDKLRESIHEEFAARNKRQVEVEKIQKQLDMFSGSQRAAVLIEPKSPFGNFGQSCHLSVVLQAIARNPHVLGYFLNNEDKPKHCTDEACVACALSESLKQLLITEDKDGHAPVGLLDRSWLKREALGGYGGQDVHEYFQFILNQLHESSGVDSPHGANDCECMAHKTFSGRLRSHVSCLDCGTISVTYEPIVNLSLDIRPEISRTTPVTPLSLLDCIRNFATPQRLPAAEGYTCDSDVCKGTAQIVTKHLTFKRLPATLCIHIKRYQLGNRESTTSKLLHRVEFPTELNMIPYTSYEQDGYWKNATPYTNWLLSANLYDREQMIDETISSFSSPSDKVHGWYDLSSMVVHFGNVEGGHYVIYCKEGGQWLSFDEHDVSRVSEKDILSMNPYMMFYEQRDKSGVEEPEIEPEPEFEMTPTEPPSYQPPMLEFDPMEFSDIIDWDA